MVRLGQRDGPVGRRRLERGQVRGLAGHGHQLLPHLQRSPQEVDWPDLQSECLAVAHSGPGRQHDKRAVALRHGGNQGLDQLGSQRLDPLRLPLGQPHLNARRGDDQPVALRSPEYAGHERVDDLDG
jgi:hypothetical protein